jgi:hypothetical protein
MGSKLLLTLKRLAERSAATKAGEERLPVEGRAPSSAASWVVWRQDENGNRFQVRVCSSPDEAFEVARKFEARGHKQLYWVERER